MSERTTRARPTPGRPPEDAAEDRQPTSQAEVQEAVDEVEHLGQHRRGFDDAAGINPRRSQDSAGRTQDEPTP